MTTRQGSQATAQKANIVTVQLPDGQEAPLLVANLNKDIKMAVVSQNVLKFLTSLLPTADVPAIVASFIDKLRDAKYSCTMEEYVAMLREELEFHESVNLIKEFYAEENPVAEPVNVTA